jgi:UDP-N-acetylmuramoyl-L-alanyl-D-glutamate--2,6-diaminopimelate ligase
MKLTELRATLNGARTYHFSDREIRGVIHDSRRMKKDFIFVAIKGAKFDGHDFAKEAVERGAVAVIAERKLDLPETVTQIVVTNARLALAALAARFYGDPSTKMRVVGVTGTNGKTTTTHLIKHIVEATGEQAGLIGTVGYKIGERELPPTTTTPESIDLQGYLAEMVSANIRHAAMEVSSHALLQHRVAFVRFAVGVFTNLTRDHLDYHKTLEAYLDAKARLFEGLSAEGFAVLNADDAAYATLRQRTRARVISYGINASADVTARIESVTLEGAKFELRGAFGKLEIQSPLIGKHNVYNALAATSAAFALGLDPSVIKKGLESLRGVPGRLEPVPNSKGLNIVVDYAHTPDALENVLSALRPLVKGRMLLVFGCGGDRDRTKRPIMGGIGERLSDLLWITSDNPRTEDPMRIIGEIEAGVKDRSRYRVEPEREAAIREAVKAARPGDLVLIAGKGHERYQIFKDTIVPFDDRDVARRAAEAV